MGDMKKILIMGLPGTGKTTLASELNKLLSPDCLWLNADAIRDEYDDWDFSVEGRIRQADRMQHLANNSDKSYVICDFIAPLQIMRDIFSPDFIIWVDTIETSKYEDTNQLFVNPEKYDIRVITQDWKYWASIILTFLV